MAADRIDVYSEVTDRIISALESGTIPWRKPWIASAGSHRNPVSGTVYRGINPFLLDMTAMANGYSDPRWLTFKQARTLGGAIRKGETSTLVVFWKMLKGKDKLTGEERMIPVLRHFRVFNVAQADGCELPALEEREAFDPLVRCEEVIDGMPSAPTIGYGGNRAFYAPAMDHVQLPDRDQFETAERFYCTAFHELAHSTGHESRLKRADLMTVNGFGDESYSREELTAEMTAAMLCGVSGIVPATIDQSAAYIRGWLRALKDDRKLVVSAAGRAQRAADFILDKATS